VKGTHLHPIDNTFPPAVGHDPIILSGVFEGALVSRLRPSNDHCRSAGRRAYGLVWLRHRYLCSSQPDRLSGRQFLQYETRGTSATLHWIDLSQNQFNECRCPP